MIDVGVFERVLSILGEFLYVIDSFFIGIEVNKKMINVFKVCIVVM